MVVMDRAVDGGRYFRLSLVPGAPVVYVVLRHIFITGHAGNGAGT
jgi:hypothetical protein